MSWGFWAEAAFSKRGQVAPRGREDEDGNVLCVTGSAAFLWFLCVQTCVELCYFLCVVWDVSFHLVWELSY